MFQAKTTRRFLAAELIVAAVVLLNLCGCRNADSDGNRVPAAQTPIELSNLVEITGEVGLEFVHEVGRIGDYSMPQIMGSGAALFDFDNDDDLDILLINGGSADRVPRQPQQDRVTSRLFRQEPDGTFVDVTQTSQLLNDGYGMGAAIGDMDNDGDLDVYLTNYGQDRLFQNNGNGTFTDITESAGIANPRWGTAACFFDHDQDGWLDLLVVNYLDYFPGSICEDGSGRRDYCGPESFAGSVDNLYRNRTHETASRKVAFEDITVTSGIAALAGRGLGALCRDLDDDGRPDIYVANDMEPNRLWIQQEDGTYRDQAMLRGVAVNRLGRPEASMGLAHGDLDGDDWPDIFVTHLRGETNTLYRTEQPGRFMDTTSSSGLGPASLQRTGFGVAAVDLEHDGDLDVVIVNGGVKREPSPESADDATNASQSHWSEYAERNQVFLNSGRGTLVELQPATGAAPATADFLHHREVSRGLACGDIDNDGDIDLLVTNAGGPARLFRNDIAKQGNWLTLRAIDPNLKRDSIGAQVRVQAGARRVQREVNPSSSYLCSHDLRLHFGLGDAPRYDQITVRWPGPDARVEQFPGGESNRTLVLVRGTGRAGEPAIAQPEADEVVSPPARPASPVGAGHASQPDGQPE